jgi:hypothetical protein
MRVTIDTARDVRMSRRMAERPPAWQVGQAVLLKKPHPCGGRRWLIYKLGMDVGLHCQQCGQRVKLGRRKFEHAVERTGRHIEC